MQNGVRDTTLPKSNGPIGPQLNRKDNANRMQNNKRA